MKKLISVLTVGIILLSSFCICGFSSFAKTTKTEWERPRPRDLLSFVNSKPSDDMSI